MSPTNLIAWLRFLMVGAIAGWVVVQLWSPNGLGATVAATALAAALAVDRVLGIMETTKTADSKDLQKLEDKVDRM